MAALFDSYDRGLEMQRFLSIPMQIPIPVIGHLVGWVWSPVKAAVSAIQLIVGLLAAIVFGSLGALCMCCTDCPFTAAAWGAGQAAVGLLSLGYCVANLLTAGHFCYKLEKEMKKE